MLAWTRPSPALTGSDLHLYISIPDPSHIHILLSLAYPSFPLGRFLRPHLAGWACQIYSVSSIRSNPRRAPAATTMVAAHGRVLLRVVALLLLAAAAAGNSAVVSLRELDGRRDAAREARNSRYAADMLGNSEFRCSNAEVLS